MNLHRSSGHPDWLDVPPRSRNQWQELAASTSGVVTPGNAFTVIGFVLVLVGLILVWNHQYWLGLVIVGVGRLCDIWDGMAAERTGTKSPLGEMLDAGFDKLACLAAFILLVVVHIIPLPVAVLLLLPNLSNAAITIWANRHARAVHPSRLGKLFMAASWVALSCFILAAALQWSRHSWLGLLGYALVGVSFVLGLLASVAYVQSIRPAQSVKSADL